MSWEPLEALPEHDEHVVRKYLNSQYGPHYWCDTCQSKIVPQAFLDQAL